MTVKTEGELYAKGLLRSTGARVLDSPKGSGGSNGFCLDSVEPNPTLLVWRAVAFLLDFSNSSVPAAREFFVVLGSDLEDD